MATNRTNDDFFRQLGKSADIYIAIAVVGVIILMIIPLPAFLLDVLQSLSLSLGIIVILTVMYTVRAIDLSVFPSLLLITSLFRIALNISSTRLILLQGPAFQGQVVRAFGSFVVGGNFVVGFIIFIIITIVQLLVITRGGGRIAEVAARFTLDAMPGKQMAIDADLNSGLITQEEARERRDDVRSEADFYGAMDGAAKFVSGDVIAGVIVTVINLIGGFIIGVAIRGEQFSDALRTYGLLTVGDGLVVQIPALMVSSAMGLIVTRASSESSLGSDLTSQLSSQPKALAIASGVMVLFAIVPGLPTVPFLILAVAVGALAYLMNRSIKSLSEERLKEEREMEEIKKPENVVSLVQVDPMGLEIGYSVIPLVDPNQGGDMLDRITMIRRQTAIELGLVVPPIRVQDNMRLVANAYIIKIKNVEVASGEIMADRYLAMNPGTVTEELEGENTIEPAFGLPAVWITEEGRENAEKIGYTVVDPPSVIATHLTEVIKSHAYEILGRQEVQSLVDSIKESYPAVVEEAIPNLLSIGEVHSVLSNLLKEGVPIRDMVTILETLADNARLTKDTDLLTEYVRTALARQISKQYQTEEEAIPVITLDPNLEQTILDSIEQSDKGEYITLQPDIVQRMLDQLSVELERSVSQGYQGVVLCSSSVRRYFKKLTERVSPGLVVLGYSEIVPGVKIESMGMVSLDAVQV